MSINGLSFSLDHCLLICKVVTTFSPTDCYCPMFIIRHLLEIRMAYSSGACLKRGFPSLTYDGAAVFVPKSSRINTNNTYLKS